jgi:uncharacterized membrane protein
MHDLIVVGFRGKERASEVLNQLLQLAYGGTLDLFDGVAAHRTDDGKLRIDDSIQPLPRETAGLGAVFAALLGALIAGPFTSGLSVAAAVGMTGAAAAGAGAIGAAVGAHDAAISKEKHGLSEEFVKEVGRMIQPGDSAVFAILETKNRERVIEAFRGHGGTALRTTLSPDVVKRAQDSLQA